MRKIIFSAAAFLALAAVVTLLPAVVHAAPAAAAIVGTSAVTVTAPAAVTAPLTPTAAAAPAAPVQVFATASTGTKNLNLRSGPGLQYPIVGKAANGVRLPAVARDAGGQWVQVYQASSASPLAWASAAYVTLSAPVAQLPVVKAAAPPPAPAVSAAAARPAPAAAPAAPPAALMGKLAVPVFDTRLKTYNIWTVNADGSDLRQVAAQASDPALSPDGRRLAYRHWQRDDRGLVVANSDGGSPLRLTQNLEDVLPSFSPDGTKLAFSSYKEGDRRSRLYYVWTDEQKFKTWEWGAGGIFGEDPSWGSDGRIVYRSTWPNEKIQIMVADGSSEHPIYSGKSAMAPAVSPDSRTVAFMANDDGHWDIYTIGIDGQNLRRLTVDPANDGLPAWSPDGRSLAFVSDRSGRWGLWVMDADGSNQRLIVTLPGPVDGRVEFEQDYLNHGWLEEQIAWSR